MPRRAAVALVCGLLCLPPLASAAGAAPRPVPHDLHLVYGDMAVEGTLIAGRIRFFKNDLERALGPLVDASSLRLEPGDEADAMVLRYLREHLRIRVDGEELELSLLDSGEDELDREPMWWVLVQFRAPHPPEALQVSNTLLFELFDDQRDIFKFVHFPDETTRTFYFAAGESEHIVRF